jgi:hypothetical protein
MDAPTVESFSAAQPGQSVGYMIKIALMRVKAPGVPFAYFQHNGVIVTVDRDSTVKSVYRDWANRLTKLCEVAVEELSNA